MEWSNEKVLEFLEAFKKEPCLWDPKDKTYKHRSSHAFAWRRISRVLTFETTVDDLKKKKEALMGYYRIHIRKYKESLKDGAGYTTTWFAFDVMNSFLQPIYAANIIIPKIESTSGVNEEIQRYFSSSSVNENEPLEHRPSSVGSNESSEREIIIQPQRETLSRKRQINEDVNNHEIQKTMAKSTKSRELDEYDHFAFMIAAKIRKIKDETERETLMNNIQNMVFKSIMKNYRTQDE